MTIRGTCAICGAYEVIRASVVRWHDRDGGQFEAVDRCIDVAACKERVMLRGDEWPIDDPKVTA